MPAESAFEKYMRREPLTPELAAIRDGKETAARDGALQQLLIAASQGRPAEGEDKPLSKGERQALREAQQMGGVTSLIRLLRTSLHRKIRQATIDSENDPLGRQNEIAQTWALISAFRRACQEVETLIRMEIEELERDERGQ